MLTDITYIKDSNEPEINEIKRLLELSIEERKRIKKQTLSIPASYWLLIAKDEINLLINYLQQFISKNSLNIENYKTQFENEIASCNKLLKTINKKIEKKQPESKIHKTTTHVKQCIIAHKQTFYTPVTTDTFLNTRFEIFSDDARHCIISGSTFSDTNEYFNEKSLDTASVGFIRDANGIVIGLAQATSDGLGHAFEREQESLVKVTSYCNEKFVTTYTQSPLDKTLPHPRQLLFEIGKQSTDYRLPISPHSKLQFFDSHSAMIGTVALLRSDYRYDVFNISIGDVMGIIIDGTSGRIKATIPARIHSGKYGDQFSPYTMQGGNEIQNHIPEAYRTSEKVCVCNAGDFIVHITDGIYSALETAQFKVDATKEMLNKRENQSYYYCDTTIKQENFTMLSSLLQLEQNIPAYIIASNLVKLSSQRELNIRNKVIGLANKLSDILSKEDKTKPFFEWKNTIEDKMLSHEIDEYIKRAQHDGVNYTPETTLEHFLTDLQPQCFGDCSTISIARLPNYQDELVRALVEFPQDYAALIPHILSEISEQNFDDIATRLKAELYVPRDVESGRGVRYLSVNRIPKYSSNEIDTTIETIRSAMKQKRSNPRLSEFSGSFVFSTDAPRSSKTEETETHSRECAIM